MNHEQTKAAIMAAPDTAQWWWTGLDGQNDRVESRDFKSFVAALEGERDRYKAALEQVMGVGHNDECLFCGFKDRTAKLALVLFLPC